MKKFLMKLFFEFQLFNISWAPYNGGESYSFGVYLAGFRNLRGSADSRHLFCYQIEKFYQWDKSKTNLDILFIHIL